MLSTGDTVVSLIYRYCIIPYHTEIDENTAELRISASLFLQFDVSVQMLLTFIKHLNSVFVDTTVSKMPLKASH